MKPLFPTVDRTTFALPDPTMLAIVRAIFGAQINDYVQITQGEYDSIPEPRPTDVLYVVTP